MGEQVNIDIREYNDSMASKMADMYNSWDDLWPGGFTQGVPYDEERVRQQYENTNAIGILVAWDLDEDAPAGSCTLYEHWRDENAAYIATLGVSPQYLDKKVGKRLLLESISLATRQGFCRVDLNTWPGNMRAVPLYKKIGFMWNPEGSGLHMEDYIPLILTHPICRPFFEDLEGPSSWYDLHEREIKQAPDDYERDGVKIYPYRFERGDDVLEVLIDRYARGITAIRRTIDGKTIDIDARVTRHLTLCGIPSTYSLRFDNEQDKSVEVEVELLAFDGLEFHGSERMRCKLEPGQTKEWHVPFVLTGEAPLFRPELTTPCIEAQLKIDGKETVLTTGIVVKPAAEVVQRLNDFRIAAGGDDSLVLTAVAADSSIKHGKMHVDVDSRDLQISESELPLEFVEGIAGAVVRINASEEIEASYSNLWARLTLDAEDLDGNPLSVTTRRFKIPIYCLKDSTVALGYDERARKWGAMSRTYRAFMSEEGAILKVTSSNQKESTTFTFWSEIGPPFGISPFRYAVRKPVTGDSGCESWIEMSAEHPERPIIVSDRVVFEKGSGIIRREVWVENTGVDEHSLQVRILGGDGISLDSGRSFVPLREGVLESPVGSSYSVYPSVTSNAGDWAEGWVAYDSSEGTTGIFWNPQEVDEIRLGMKRVSRLVYPPVTLSPGEKRRLSSVFLLIGADGWEDVVSHYEARIKHSFPQRAVEHDARKTHPLLEVRSHPVIAESVEPSEVVVELRKITKAPMAGRLEIECPEGWSCHIEHQESTHPEGDQRRLTIENLEITESFDMKMQLTPGDSVPHTFGFHTGSILFRTNMVFGGDFHVLVLGDEKSNLSIERITEQAKEVYTIDNGVCQFKVSPDFGGCITSLRTNSTELLISSFPEPSPKPGGFLENYYGGVQPLVFSHEPGDDLTKAPTNKEEMVGMIVDRGILSGVRVEWGGSLQQSTRGVDFALEYFTSHGSPLILVRLSMHNRTTGAVSFMPSLFLDAAFDGLIDNVAIRTEWENELQDIRLSNVISAIQPTANFVWIRDVTRPAVGLALLTASADPSLLALLAGQIMVIGTYDSQTNLLPGESGTVVSCLLVNPDSAEQLAKLQELLKDIASG